MNYGLFQWINDIAGRYPFLDKGMIFITDNVPYVVIVFMLYLWFTANKEKRVEKHILLYTLSLHVYLDWVLNALIHLVYYHPRPFIT